MRTACNAPENHQVLYDNLRVNAAQLEPTAAIVEWVTRKRENSETRQSHRPGLSCMGVIGGHYPSELWQSMVYFV